MIFFCVTRKNIKTTLKKREGLYNSGKWIMILNQIKNRMDRLIFI